MQFAGRTLYHGTSKKDAESILLDGIDQTKSANGYFGTGFYVAEDYELAQSNYAKFSDGDDAGVVLACRVADNARILDLTEPDAWEVWQHSGLPDRLGRSDFWQLAVNAGIDGVFDRSFGGVVIYNPEAVIAISQANPAAAREAQDAENPWLQRSDKILDLLRSTNIAYPTTAREDVIKIACRIRFAVSRGDSFEDAARPRLKHLDPMSANAARHLAQLLPFDASDFDRQPNRRGGIRP